MDMTNAPNPAILHAFYTRMGGLAVAYVLVVLILSFAQRRRRRLAVSRTGVMAADGPGFDGRPHEPPAWRRLMIHPTRYDAVQAGLGLLWLLDGLLQAQPDMSSELLSNIVVPMFSTLPSPIVRLLEPLVVFFSEYPVTFDLLLMWTQITLGLLLLFARSIRLQRFALQVSLVWGLGVWVVGEGMGAMYGTGVTWLAGSPGAALFYMAAAALLLQGRESWRDGRVARELRWLFACLWLWGALVQAWPANGFWNAGGIAQPLASMAAMPQPHVLSALLYGCARLFAAHPVLWNGILVGVMLLLAVGNVIASRHPMLLYATCAWLVFTWMFGQDFGVLGGLGTDPNSSPAAALLLVGMRLDSPVHQSLPVAPDGAQRDTHKE